MAKLMHLLQITQLSKYQSWDALGGMKPRQSRQSQLLFCLCLEMGQAWGMDTALEKYILVLQSSAGDIKHPIFRFQVIQALGQFDLHVVPVPLCGMG